ncbi:7-carboxy-7-deazaguanine synthase [Desulfonema ishimotonii]|uniref:7-carboxy-7-deazaguanine synthase n=1 Tax=Desulfonema ishimotonii TaxID=45657 RepID=A0A401FU04_9BACT|nr:radical SAM protein [Desulfonema ishimotonii]GBC60435.1 7-carboxy-7-deazaguanine synthase [Desulfonema ishimotonii]
MTLRVNEIFYSIQGESTYVGRPCVFVRLTGCNLRCAYCDTRYAWDAGEEMSVDRILMRVAAYDCPLVEITGGEPLLQAETPALVSALLRKGYEVLMETNGSLDIRKADAACVKIVDIKCPGSGESRQNDFENLNRLGQRDQVKFVIGNRDDYEYAKDIVLNRCAGAEAGHLLFSPVSGKLPPDRLARWILDDRLRVRLQIQLHTILWPGTERGV